jgi:hypothetical protein
MKKGDKVGVISDFHTKDGIFHRGKNVEIGKDLSLEDAKEAAIAGRLATPAAAEKVAKADKAAADKADKGSK